MSKWKQWGSTDPEPEKLSCLAALQSWTKFFSSTASTASSGVFFYPRLQGDSYTENFMNSRYRARISHFPT